MNNKGKLTVWKTTQGYGYLAPNSGDKPLFVHKNSFNDSAQPRIGQTFVYTQSVDTQGRRCAINVRHSRPQGKRRSAPNNSYLAVTTAFIFMFGMIAAVWLNTLSWWLLVYYLFMSFGAVWCYIIDKNAARKGLQRIPENALHSLALMGGWPGAFVAKLWLRHKSSKKTFILSLWVVAVMNCLALFACLVALGIIRIPKMFKVLDGLLS